MATPETRKMVLVAAAACEDKKATDTRILELDAADASFTDYFLVTSGSNPRQTQTIADEIQLRLKREFGTYPNSVEGYKQAEWVLLDYVDFVVHIFLEERRAFYDIERLRKTARSVGQEELKRMLAKPAWAASKSAANKRPTTRSTPAGGPAKRSAKTAAKAPLAKKAGSKAVSASVVKQAAAKKRGTAPKFPTR